MSQKPRPDIRAQILAAARSERSPTRAQVTRHVGLVAAGGVVLLVAVFFGLGGLLLGDRPAGFVLHAALAWLLTAVASSAILLRRGSTGLGSPTGLLLGCGLAVAPLLAVTYVGLHGAEAAHVGHGPVKMLAHPMCFVLTVVFAVAPFALFAALRRGTDPVHPRATGALAGAASAAIGGVAITLHCPLAADLHVLLGHALPSAVMLLVGFLLGPRLFGLRTSR